MAHFNKLKAFGQHFLNDASVIQAIVGEGMKALEENPRHSLLEIGPGNGALTDLILKSLSTETSFYLAERDRELVTYWKGNAKVKKILEGDFIEQTTEALDAIAPIVVVSNLPYSAGTSIVVKLAEMKVNIPVMILMFQAEVAKRLYSPPSTPDRGSLSLYIQNEWDVERLLVVKPSAFTPPPKVMSEVVRLKRRDEPHISVESSEKRDAWNDLLKTAFKQRRKMLRGNFSGTTWQKAFEASGVDPTKRAESLGWDDWKAIWSKKF